MMGTQPEWIDKGEDILRAIPFVCKQNHTEDECAWCRTLRRVSVGAILEILLPDIIREAEVNALRNAASDLRITEQGETSASTWLRLRAERIESTSNLTPDNLIYTHDDTI